MATIDEVPIPDTLDAPSGPDFIAAIELGSTVEAIDYGTPDGAYEPAEELPTYQDRFLVHRLLVARESGTIVGKAFTRIHSDDDNDEAWLQAQVLPEWRGRGIGRALADAAESLAREQGARKLLSFMASADFAGERLIPPTGIGSIPADSRDVRFLLTRGYRLEQVERMSRLPLPIPDLDTRLAGALVASGREYALRSWVGGVPERWLDDIAILSTRMSTDAPTAGLDEDEDVWTADRVRERDAREAEGPRTRVVTAVEHVPSGHLVGFTVLSVPRQRHRAADQYATLVLREHRGHRLGMLIKLANLAKLEEAFPGHPSVMTFNAEENRHMLDVNEALGFAPVASEGSWRKDVP